MNSVTLRFVAVSVVLVFEAILIVINIPALNLVAGIVLLGVLLFVLGQLVSSRAKSAPKDKRKKTTGGSGRGTPVPEESRPGPSAGSGIAEGGAGKGTPGPEKSLPPSRPGIFARVGTRIRKLKVPSRSRAARPSSESRATPKGKGLFGRKVKTGQPDRSGEPSGEAAQTPGGSTAAPAKTRFETVGAMRRGLGLLFASRRRKSPEAGHEASETAAVKTTIREGGSAGISLASVKSDAVSPVRQKPEPSPFSPLEKDMELDPDLVFSLQEQGVDPSADILHSDIDPDSIEIFAHDGEIAAMDISLDDETSITIDEEEDDEVAEILAAHHDEIAAPVREAEEFSIEKGLDELEQFDLDLDEVEPEGGQGIIEPSPEPVQPARAAAPTGAGTGQTGPFTMPAAARKPADEGMLSFTSPSSGDDDLLSSLRSDMTRKKHQIDQSLVRDLKDVRVHIGEIERDITELLDLYKKMK